MAHETHHETSNGTEKKSKTSMSASFWFVLILAGLFIAAVNFVNIIGEEHGEEGAKTEHVQETNGEAAHTEAGAATDAHTATEAHSSEAAQPTADSAHAAHH